MGADRGFIYQKLSGEGGFPSGEEEEEGGMEI